MESSNENGYLRNFQKADLYQRFFLHLIPSLENNLQVQNTSSIVLKTKFHKKSNNELQITHLSYNFMYHNIWYSI